MDIRIEAIHARELRTGMRQAALDSGLAVLLCLALGQAARADDAATAPPRPWIALADAEPSYLDLAAGGYAAIGNHEADQTYGGRAEFRLGEKFYHVGPAVGAVADIRGGFATFVAGYSDIDIGRFVLTPLAGVGTWFRGNSRDENLGGTFEFRLELTAAYQLEDGSRLGVTYGHLSSSGINRANPGESEFMISYGLPLSF